MSSEESIAIVQSSGKLIAVRREEARGGSVKFDEAVRNISLAGEEANQTNPLSAPLREIAAELDDTILSIVIPVAQTTCQILTLPTVDSTELDSMTRLRLEQLAPFDAEKLAISWETLAQDAESTRVIAAALPVESVESWWNAIAECGLRAKRLELSILAWWHAIRASNAIPDSGRQLVLLRDGEALGRRPSPPEGFHPSDSLLRFALMARFSENRTHGTPAKELCKQSHGCQRHERQLEHGRDVRGDDEGVGKKLEDEEDKKIIAEAISGLGEREREIIELRFGLNGKKEKTQKEVADMLGISQSYISRLEKKIIDRLRSEIEGKI